MITVVVLRHPPGAVGYAIVHQLSADRPPLYAKLELVAGKVYGRSFHYSYGDHREMD